jgi:tRNA U55 pseudouridine synthase TruB
MLEWYDEHSFPTPKIEASEEERKIERSIAQKKYQSEQSESGENIGDEVGPACKLRMTVSGGFYVRSLCYDIGLKLNSGAYMAELTRTRQGEMRLEDAVPWEDFVDGGKWEEKVVQILRTQEHNADKDESDEAQDGIQLQKGS